MEAELWTTGRNGIQSNISERHIEANAAKKSETAKSDLQLFSK